MEHILRVLLDGLRKVEYRGYDSAGVCVDATSPSTAVDAKPPAVLVRSVGNISVLDEAVFSDETRQRLDMSTAFTNHVGIAHTRWATHGEVCVRNCHPQQSNHGEFSVVHNGIMTNFMTTKQFLTGEGYTFQSDTDTEVICVLSEYLYSKKGVQNFIDLAVHLSHLVEGAYALLIKSVYFPGEIIACRKGSPLVIGFRQHEVSGTRSAHPSFVLPDFDNPMDIYFASDSNSFAEYTSRAVYLEDNDIVHYTVDKGLQFYAVSELSHDPVDRVYHQLEITLESLSKGNYPHFMLKEIYEQAESIVNSMRGRITFSTGRVRLGGFTPSNVDLVLASRRLLLISCGTSLNSCTAVRPLLEELLPLPVSLENASDFLDRSPHIARSDACIFVSQSGETADTLLALKYCRSAGAICIGITNVVGSSISRQTDFGAHLNAGVEVGVASTKAYTSQVVVLTLLALLLSGNSLKLAQRRQDIATGLCELAARVTEVLRTTAGEMEGLARKLKDAQSIIVLGRGNDYSTAMEAALKIKELSYVHTEGINSGELKHGPLALVDHNMPILALCSNDKHFSKSKAAVQQTAARKGNVIVFTTVSSDTELYKAASEVVVLPATVDCLQCVVNAVPFQLLAYYMALMRGNNVDCPRNLAKSVTVQ